MSTLYDKLPVEMLIQFVYYLDKNIEQGILSEAMFSEIELIEKSMTKHGLRIVDCVIFKNRLPLRMQHGESVNK